MSCRDQNRNSSTIHSEEKFPSGFNSVETANMQALAEQNPPMQQILKPRTFTMHRQ